jgi:hypothetical protein
MTPDRVRNGRHAEVTFADFAALARRRGWSVAFLTERFRGQIEQPQDFFTRVMQGQYAAVVIPYNSVLAFYRQERGLLGTDHTGRRCACGCGSPVFDRKRWASRACRQRGYRARTQVAA